MPALLLLRQILKLKLIVSQSYTVSARAPLLSHTQEYNSWGPCLSWHPRTYPKKILESSYKWISLNHILFLTEGLEPMGSQIQPRVLTNSFLFSCRQAWTRGLVTQPWGTNHFSHSGVESTDSKPLPWVLLLALHHLTTLLEELKPMVCWLQPTLVQTSPFTEGLESMESPHKIKSLNSSPMLNPHSHIYSWALLSGPHLSFIDMSEPMNFWLLPRVLTTCPYFL